jgi:catechol 2,3-dioxygenase
MTRRGVPPPGYRLPDDTHVGAVRLQVSDLGRSLDYYDQVLGLRPAELSRAGAVLAAQGDDRPLVELREKPGVRPVPRGGLLGLYHFAIRVPDRSALGRFVAHLAAIGVHAGSADHAVSESVYLTDPDGLGIEVYADRPRSSWRREASGHVFMTIAPLDVPGVLAAAGGASWSGMPARTDMGHVHLHVGDLDQASAFYHLALGLDKTLETYPGALFLAAGGYHHHLGTNTWSHGDRADDRYARLLSWDLVVPGTTDAAAATASLTAAGYNVTAGDAAGTAADPWGTVVRIVSI